MSDFRILVVCTGNVHRSAFADVLLRAWSTRYLAPGVAANVSVSSAGTRAPTGALMDAKMRAIVATLGGDGTGHRAVQLTDNAIERADLVLVATRRHREAVLSRVPSALRRTFTIREAGRIADLLRSGHLRAPANPLAGLGSASTFAPAEQSHLVEMKSIVRALADLRVDAGVASSDDDIADPEGHGAEAFDQMLTEELPALTSLACVLLAMPEDEAQAYAARAAGARPT